ncbi:MAG: S9 family peptidase [Bryobacterales bacterium]|nr:S9 family peptidase [Bryobacteraceae bacterium]MDW8354640.1 S9 family peptidase [Bryobacterales bacterium]
MNVLRFLARNLSLAAWVALWARAAYGLTPQEVVRLRSVTEAAIAPDGSAIAYVLRVPRRPIQDPDGPAWAELHLVRRDGTVVPFVTGDVTVSQIAWMPDGRTISFLAKRGGDKFTSLYGIAADGGEARRLVSHGSDITGYSWAPDGRRVAFLATEPLPEAKQKRRDQGFTQRVYEEDWRAVRVWLATVGPDSNPPRALELPGSASELHWSPAGDRIAVALAPTPLVDDDYMNRKLHVVEVDTGRVRARLENPGKLGAVRWSPDGKYLAFLSAADRNDPAAGRLMVAPAEGGAPRNVLEDLGGHVTDLAWLGPSVLAYTEARGTGSAVRSVRPDGSGGKILAGPGGPVFTSLTASRDGRWLAFVAHTPRHPPEVYLLGGGASPSRLTRSNPWLDEERLAPQEVIRFRARDGLELEAVLIRPRDEQKGSRYPLILDVHGGPEAHYSHGWLTSYLNPGQMAAAKGMAVLAVNYRGSTGRGVEFSKLGQGDPAGKEFDDLIDAIEHLTRMGLADPKRVGITGGSYGGYASAWAATRYSERFAAAVMFVGLSELVSFFGTTDIPHEFHDVHFRKWPWEAWELMRERSPLAHLDKHRTPLLILHGEADPRVHPSQSLLLYRYLKLRGQAPVRLVLYPGEPHGNQRAASRLDYSLRMLQWFEHYLNGPGGAPPPYELDYE